MSTVYRYLLVSVGQHNAYGSDVPSGIHEDGPSMSGLPDRHRGGQALKLNQFLHGSTRQTLTSAAQPSDNQSMPIQLVMFDFDGTLVDTAPDLIRTTNLFLESKGQKALPEKTIRSHIGFGLKNLMLDSFPEAKEHPAKISEIEKEFLAIYDQQFLHSPQLYPNAREFLETWTGSLAIVSNKRARYIHPILKHLEIDTLPWSAIIGGDTFAQMKPHPTPFLEAMKNAGTDRASTVMVGDGEPDIEGALTVGIHSIAVSFGYSSIERLVHLGAGDTIGNFSELTGKLKVLT